LGLLLALGGIALLAGSESPEPTAYKISDPPAVS
jgi:hypothetical protein